MEADGLVKILSPAANTAKFSASTSSVRATGLIPIAGSALGTESTLEDVISTIFAHPTVSEALHEAALATRKRAIRIPNRRRCSRPSQSPPPGKEIRRDWFFRGPHTSLTADVNAQLGAGQRSIPTLPDGLGCRANPPNPESIQR